MKTTSLELSKKLYEAYGWQTEFLWREIGALGWKVGRWENHPKRFYDRDDTAPAYDTDFLLDKLPKFVGDDKVPHLLCLQPNPVGKGWMAFYRHKSISPSHRLVETSHVAEAGIPAEALGNLALALKEKGLL